MNELKTPKKPLLFYYGIALALLILFNFLVLYFAAFGFPFIMGSAATVIFWNRSAYGAAIDKKGWRWTGFSDV